MGQKTIVICGGHLAPAISLIEKLKEKKIDKYSICYIGRKNPLEGDKSLSLEYITLSQSKIPFYSIRTGRLQRSLTRFSLTSLLKFPVGLFDSFKLIIKLRPKIVVSFGGYIALPVCLAAWFLKIPVVTHEQTHILGVSNRIISRLARVIFLTWSDTKKIPKGVRVVVSGIPIRRSIFAAKGSEIVNFGNKNLPLIYITGGSLGSRALNKEIANLIPKLLHSFRVIHQCGTANNASDYKMLQNVKNSLPGKTERNYQLIKHIHPDQIGSVLKHALMVIARSGANTVAEIGAVGTPAIFVPLPWSGQAEQEKNARILENIGIAKIIKQSDLKGEKLYATIEYIRENLSNFRKNREIARKLFSPEASEKIVEVIEDIIKTASK